MRIALVTGASSGIGREFVRQLPHFYRELDEIWVTARRADRLEGLSAICPLPIRIFPGDLTSPNLQQVLRKRLSSETPDIRMLVNAAGFGKSGSAEEIEQNCPHVQAEMIDLNCKALTQICLLVLPFLSEGSRVVNIASAAAFCPQKHFAVYAASKSYVLSFSRALHAELRCRGIFVTAVCPGPVNTEFFRTSGHPENLLKRLVMAEPTPVVKKALLDVRRRKAVSVPGRAMQILFVITKLIPHGWILKLW